MSFAAVPLYRLFCQVTGYGGTPSIGLAAAPGGSNETIKVRFNADTNPALPWKFAPDQTEVSLKLGEEKIAFYHATNQAQQAVTGMALYNVTPDKVGKYFHKTACFCFNQQTLQGGQDHGIPGEFLGGPGDPRRSQHVGRQDDHAVLHLLPLAGRRGEIRRAGEGGAACRSAVAAGPQWRREGQLKREFNGSGP